MDTTTRPPVLPDELAVLQPDQGHHLHFLNHLATVKVTAGATGSLSAVEFTAPKGFGPPLHSHRHEDEYIVVLDGEMVFRSGEIETVAGPSACAYLPRNVPHSFQVLSESARFLSITGSSQGAPRFDLMVDALGTPTDAPTLPEPVDIDPGWVALEGARHGVDILGPPPAPLHD